MEKIIAGLVQMDSGPDMNENMRMAEQYVREAAEQGAKLILFPETAEYTGADMPGHASAVHGAWPVRHEHLLRYPLSGTVPADGILRSRCISDSGGFYESNGRAPLGSTAAHARH